MRFDFFRERPHPLFHIFKPRLKRLIARRERLRLGQRDLRSRQRVFIVAPDMRFDRDHMLAQRRRQLERLVLLDPARELGAVILDLFVNLIGLRHCLALVRIFPRQQNIRSKRIVHHVGHVLIAQRFTRGLDPRYRLAQRRHPPHAGRNHDGNAPDKGDRNRERTPRNTQLQHLS